MRNIQLSSLVLSGLLFLTTNPTFANAPNPTVQIQGDQVRISKGDLDIDALTKLVATKQQEVAREYVKNLLIGKMSDGSFAQDYLNSTLLNSLLLNSNPQIITQSVYDYSVQYLVLEGIAHFLLQEPKDDALNKILQKALPENCLLPSSIKSNGDSTARRSALAMDLALYYAVQSELFSKALIFKTMNLNGHKKSEIQHAIEKKWNFKSEAVAIFKSKLDFFFNEIQHIRNKEIYRSKLNLIQEIREGDGITSKLKDSIKVSICSMVKESICQNNPFDKHSDLEAFLKSTKNFLESLKLDDLKENYRTNLIKSYEEMAQEYEKTTFYQITMKPVNQVDENTFVWDKEGYHKYSPRSVYVLGEYETLKNCLKLGDYSPKVSDPIFVKLEGKVKTQSEIMNGVKESELCIVEEADKKIINDKFADLFYKSKILDQATSNESQEMLNSLVQTMSSIQSRKMVSISEHKLGDTEIYWTSSGQHDKLESISTASEYKLTLPKKVVDTLLNNPVFPTHARITDFRNKITSPVNEKFKNVLRNSANYGFSQFQADAITKKSYQWFSNIESLLAVVMSIEKISSMNSTRNTYVNMIRDSIGNVKTSDSTLATFLDTYDSFLSSWMMSEFDSSKKERETLLGVNDWTFALFSQFIPKLKSYRFRENMGSIYRATLQLGEFVHVDYPKKMEVDSYLNWLYKYSSLTRSQNLSSLISQFRSDSAWTVHYLKNSTTTWLLNAMWTNLEIDTTSDVIKLDIVNLLKTIKSENERYPDKSSHFSPIIDVGMNYAVLPDKNVIMGVDSIFYVGYVGEKVGISYVWELGFCNSEIGKIERSISCDKPLLSRIGWDLFASGILYNLANLKTDQNFQRIVVGTGVSLHYGNGLTARLSPGLAIENQKRRSALIQISFDVSLFEYLKEIGED